MQDAAAAADDDDDDDADDDDDDRQFIFLELTTLHAEQASSGWTDWTASLTVRACDGDGLILCCLGKDI